MSHVWDPMIEVESVHGTREVSLNTRHLMNRCIFLTGSIDAEMASTFLTQLLYLEQESAEPITIYVNSPGGEVDSGLVIYDLIQGSKNSINMICIGRAYSMAAIIMAGGQRGRRYILPHSKIMIHEPLISDGVGGSATSIHNISDSIMKTKDLISDILSAHTGRDKKEINDILKSDFYMNAYESIDFGICDKITTSLLL